MVITGIELAQASIGVNAGVAGGVRELAEREVGVCEGGEGDQR